MINIPRIARLVDLVPYITRHQGIPINKLATKFMISVEELEKDLNLLWCCGLPGHTPLELMDFEFESGFVSVRNADQLRTPRALTQAEIATLIVGLELLDTEDSKKLGAKLRNLVGATVSYQPTYTENFAPQIQKAIEANRTLEISYNGKVREVIPFEIYSEDGANYLKSFCKLAGERRTFKLSKIESLTITDKQELPPNEVPSTTTKIPVKIEVFREPRRVRELLGDTANIEVFSTEWLISTVLGLAGAVSVQDPKIRAEIKSRAEAALSLYGV